MIPHFARTPDARELTLHPRLRVQLRSYRLDRYIGDGSLPHLALGRAADPLIDSFDEMMTLRRQGAADWFERCGAGLFCRDGDALRLRPSLYFDPDTTLLDPDLRFELRWRGSERVVSIPVDRPALQMLHDIVGRVARRPSLADLREKLTAEDWALVSMLADADAVVATPPPAARIRGGCTLTLVGHSCVLVETATTRLLVDPVFSVRYRPEIDLSPILAGGVDAIAISHPHWDHFNPDSLALIDPAVRVLVPACRHRRSLVNVDLAGLAGELGFGRVTALAPWTRVEIGDIALTALPYHGESSGAEGVQDWMTYAIEAAGALVVGMVDSCADDFGSMDPVLARVREQLGAADVLLSPCSSFHFTHRHVHCRPIRLDDAALPFTGSAEDTARWSAIAGARAVVPYAEFHFEADDPDTAVLSPGQRGTWRDVIPLLPAATRLVALRPGESMTLR